MPTRIERQTTRQIIDELQLERKLRSLPKEVHLAFFHRLCAQVFPNDHVLSEQEQTLIAQHPEYRAFADRALSYWCASGQLCYGPGVVEGFLRMTVLINQKRERDSTEPRPPGWPFFLDCL